MAAKLYADAPVDELTEEQVRILIDDMTEQRRAFFKKETEEYEAKRRMIEACDGPCGCCKEEEVQNGNEGK